MSAHSEAPITKPDVRDSSPRANEGDELLLDDT